MSLLLLLLKFYISLFLILFFVIKINSKVNTTRNVANVPSNKDVAVKFNIIITSFQKNAILFG